MLAIQSKNETVTGPKKTNLIYTNYTCSYWGTCTSPVLDGLNEICKLYWIPYGILHAYNNYDDTFITRLIQEIELLGVKLLWKLVHYV